MLRFCLLLHMYRYRQIDVQSKIISSGKLENVRSNILVKETLMKMFAW